MARVATQRKGKSPDAVHFRAVPSDGVLRWSLDYAHVPAGGRRDLVCHPGPGRLVNGRWGRDRTFHERASSLPNRDERRNAGVWHRWLLMGLAAIPSR